MIESLTISCEENRSTWFWAAMIGLLAFIGLPLVFASLASSPSGWRYQAASAEVIDTLPRATGGFSGERQLTLPDSWNRTRGGFGGTIDYRVTFKFSAELKRPALFIPRVKTYCDIY